MMNFYKIGLIVILLFLIKIFDIPFAEVLSDFFLVCIFGIFFSGIKSVLKFIFR